MTREKYDIAKVTKWECPEDDDRAIIAMPNLPKPLHGQAPRTLLGTKVWNEMRNECYEKANDTCEICGYKPENMRDRHAHEVYSIDYENGTSTFVRTICLCSRCHVYGIHSGRAITLHKKGNPLFGTQQMLDGAENVFRIISEYNADHPDKPELRAYDTFLDYLKCDDLREPMEKLIKKYHIKFYTEDKNKLAKWGDWKMIIGNKEYPTPYEDYQAWEKAMEENNKVDTDRKVTTRFSGGIYDKIDEIIKESKANEDND